MCSRMILLSGGAHKLTWLGGSRDQEGGTSMVRLGHCTSWSGWPVWLSRVGVSQQQNFCVWGQRSRFPACTYTLVGSVRPLHSCIVCSTRLRTRVHNKLLLLFRREISHYVNVNKEMERYKSSAKTCDSLNNLYNHEIICGHLSLT